MQESVFRCGFVGIVGPTNAGKSTLLNALVGKKLSIVSPRPQTTNRVVRGILSGPDFQLIFVDTPGFQRVKAPFSRLLNQVAQRHAGQCDLLVWIFDASNPHVFAQVQKLTPQINQFGQSICLLNKVDRVAKPKLLPLMERLFGMKCFLEIIPISALKNDGLQSLIQILVSRLPVGVPLFDIGQQTDRSTSFLVSELVREKIYEETRQELPYSVRVEIESWVENRIPNIFAVIHVDSDSRKGILIGKGGLGLKRIGMAARKDIEKMIGRQVCLKLHVHVERDWRKDRGKVSQYLELE